MKFESLTHAQHYASGMKMDIVVYENKVVDVTEFKEKHPGGANSLDKFLGKECTEAFKKIPSHETKSAIKDLNFYCIGEIVTDKDNNIIKDECTDEEVFDLKKGILWQIYYKDISKEDYLRFIHDPKHLINPPHAVMFDTPFLEFFSKTPWFMIPLVYFPFMLYYLYDSYKIFPLQLIISFYIFGFLFWTISEYILHRYVFHIDENLPEHKACYLFHFLFHGIHHAFPMDRLRLVFPPAVGLTIFYFIKNYIMSFFGIYNNIITAGYIMGYVFYDLSHYYIHHNKPLLSYYRSLKEYHIMHHYKNPHLGFGVSNKLWDYVFGTVLYEDSKKNPVIKK